MTERLKEIRIALVLYGGVSLAVYENGVVRCFYDLVKKNGIYDLLLEILNADAIVDVISGASAGGINGLMLGAALENGTDFAETADLWREHGDLGRLLRDVEGADEAVSLLDGEGYYQDKLVDAFRKLCVRPSPQYKSPGEMDIFITGTDLDGRIQTYWDDLNQEIRDKSYRTVFRLKHRPSRKSIGLGAEKNSDKDAENQAWILASIARITGTFPIAFPPFNLQQIDPKFRAAVQEALASTSGRSDDLGENNSFIDGGVLDNKPFGHAIQAIFYRMPTRVVRRHLFYVEPDPDPFRLTEPDPKKHTPFNVATSALSTIPSHESIYGDLDQLKKHNERIGWINHLTKQMLTSISTMSNADVTLYRTSRIESLARALLLQRDIAPSAEEQVADKDRMELMAPVKEGLYKLIANNLDPLDALDADFQLRRLFRMLYEYYDELESGSQNNPDAPTAMRFLGRIIKSLKLIRDMALRCRETIIKNSIEEAKGNPIKAPQFIYENFLDFFDADAEHWIDLVSCLSPRFDKDAYVDREQDLIPSPILSETLSKINRNIINGTAPQKRMPHSATILERLSDKTREIVKAMDGSEDRFQRATAIDKWLYPIQFSANVHELDRIRLTRISPRDAQKGLSSGTLGSKVTGEDFAHFSAFLRRDWRSNDILRGRIDGICQILCSLLDHGAMKHLMSSRNQHNHFFSENKLKDYLPKCPDEFVAKVEDAWMNLQTAWSQYATSSKTGPSELMEEEKSFIDSLIEATQYDAFMEDIEGVSSDVTFQEIIWGRDKSLKGIEPDTTEKRIEQEATTVANQHIKASDPKKLWKWFDGIGSQTVIGKNSAVPFHILGEYVTQAYVLLYGMLGQSLGKRRAFLQAKKIRHIFRTPVRILHEIIYMMRRQTQTAALTIAAIISAGLGIIFISIYSKTLTWIAAAAFILLFTYLLQRLTPDTKKRKVWKIIIIAVVSTTITWGITRGILYIMPILSE